jgi:hypothetical protein
MSEYEALSVATISGFTPPSRFSSASRMCRESRGVPGTTICPMPATWSLTALSQVMPRLNPKYFGDGAALTVRTGTTNRSPSTEASSPSPQNLTIGTSAWPAISRAFAAAIVSARR